MADCVPKTFVIFVQLGIPSLFTNKMLLFCFSETSFSNSQAT